MSYAVGSLVRVREREWVVMPESLPDMLILKPLGGTDDEVTGIYLPIEPVEPAVFQLPSPDEAGDFFSCRLLRDSVRVGFRSSAGPFRSFGSIAVEPRPYQLVPLLMALRIDPIRMLIADDVGVGKTIEAGLIAKELIERGEVKRMAVLCPPHLAEQWQKELFDKFHIETELVVAGTATRLERSCRIGQPVFDVYPLVVVSTDFIKSDRRRNEFLQSCPELVIVDEAHTFAFGNQSGRHQRHQLLKGLAQKSERHLILVTATPHSGKEANFRSLLGVLRDEFRDLPDDLSGKENEKFRKKLAEHLVQRRRADIRHYLKSETPFPVREDAEETYSLHPDYKKLFNKVLNYARETVTDTTGSRHRQRVRWWSALALLRSLASSPASAAATLRARAATVDVETPEQADEIGRHTVLDLDMEDAVDNIDVIPGSDEGEDDDDSRKIRRRLLDMARESDHLFGEKDEKLKKAIKLVQQLLKDGFRPILFCRFIPTAEYLAEQLRSHLSKKVEVIAVTGTLPPVEREERILQLSQFPDRVLVATDCLSEGINLQEYFDAVIHYDLSWNPTRHEQREGRVDRFGQPKDKVRVLTYYGRDNQIDGIILDVLLRKHKQIRNSLGISVPVPMDSNTVVEAIFEGLLLKGENVRPADHQKEQLSMFDDFFVENTKKELFSKWENATAREKRSRTVFAQETIKVDEVAGEMTAVQQALGSGVDLKEFVVSALKNHDASVSDGDVIDIDMSSSPKALLDMVGDNYIRFKAKFSMPVADDVRYLTRTCPFVENLASYILNSALDPLIGGKARRCGVVRSKSVNTRTTLLLLRLRFHIITRKQDEETRLLAEDCHLMAFTGSPQNAVWLDEQTAESLLRTSPDENVEGYKAVDFLSKVIDNMEFITPHIEESLEKRGEELLDAHRRVRTASRLTGITHRVEPQLPPDILGIYVFLPIPKI